MALRCLLQELQILQKTSERQARQESSEIKYLEKTSVLKILTGESKAGCLYQASRVGKNLENKTILQQQRCLRLAAQQAKLLWQSWSVA